MTVGDINHLHFTDSQTSGMQFPGDGKGGGLPSFFKTLQCNTVINGFPFPFILGKAFKEACFASKLVQNLSLTDRGKDCFFNTTAMAIIFNYTPAAVNWLWL